MSFSDLTFTRAWIFLDNQLNITLEIISAGMINSIGPCAAVIGLKDILDIENWKRNGTFFLIQWTFSTNSFGRFVWIGDRACAIFWRCWIGAIVISLLLQRRRWSIILIDCWILWIFIYCKPFLLIQVKLFVLLIKQL